MNGQGAVLEQGMGADWPADARMAAAFLLSGAAASRIGCFALDIDRLAEHVAVPSQRAAEIVALLEYDGFVRQDGGWVWIPDVLPRRPFGDSDEVRRTMPELAAVPREASFREELVRQFRVSADRPGAPAPVKANWLSELAGDAGLQPATQGGGAILDYLRRCRAF